MRNPLRRRAPKLTGRPQFVELAGRRMYITGINTTHDYTDHSTRVSLDLVDEATAKRTNRLWPGMVTVRGGDTDGK